MKKSLKLLLSMCGIIALPLFGQSSFQLYVPSEGQTPIQINQVDWENPPPSLISPIGVAQFEQYAVTEHEPVFYLMDFDITDLGGTGVSGNYYVNSVSEWQETYDEFGSPTGGHQVENSYLVPCEPAPYYGPPQVHGVEAKQEPGTKDVSINYYLLLGEGRGDAYIEYWYRLQSWDNQWQKCTALDNLAGVGTLEGLTASSGAHSVNWKAGDQLGDQVNSGDAQIRIVARYGQASGWNGYGEPGTNESGPDYQSPTGGTNDPYTTDSDGDGVMDAYDYAPNDPTIWDDPYQSPDGGYQSDPGV
jgi:hypothetical protein